MINKETPGPHSYDVPRAYQALTSQHRQPPRSKNARKRHSQFLSAAKRTSFIDPNAENPGPAAYDTFLSPRTYGYAPVHEARFRHEAQIIPGPADYEVRIYEKKYLNYLLFFRSYHLFFKILFFVEHSILH